MRFINSCYEMPGLIGLVCQEKLEVVGAIKVMLNLYKAVEMSLKLNHVILIPLKEK